MALYNLENFELMWERKLDTKALMAWNEDTVVLSFRGTASFRNVLADIKVRRGRHAATAQRALLIRDSSTLFHLRTQWPAAIFSGACGMVTCRPGMRCTPQHAASGGPPPGHSCIR